MKRIEEKVRRTWKYLRVSFQQTRGRDRLHLYLFALMMLRVPVGIAMGSVGVLGFGYLIGDIGPALKLLAQSPIRTATDAEFAVIPLFLLMGEILLRAGLSDRLYKALNVWLDRLPGGLLHTNIAASGVFSAISGSSVATAATMGSVALPFFKGSRYDPKMVLGSLAAGGALGNLIPPGITFIIYGLITETSVGALYLAAVGPSILVVVLFVLVILWKARTAAPHADPSRPALTTSCPIRSRLPSMASVGTTISGTSEVGWGVPGLSRSWIRPASLSSAWTSPRFLRVFGSTTFRPALMSCSWAGNRYSWIVFRLSGPTSRTSSSIPIGSDSSTRSSSVRRSISSK